MNFTLDAVEAAPRDRRALVELRRDGSRREWTFGELADAAASLAGRLDALGVRRGDVVLTLVGTRAEWALTMLACFRQGYVVLPCTEQLRAHDLRLRLDVAQPRLVVADERNRDTLREAGWNGGTLWVPVRGRAGLTELAPADLDPDDPCMVIFTSGTSGEPKAAVHGQRYLPGQRLQAEHWLAPQPGQLVWCTAAAGWSKSARNAFIAPWLRGAAALLHDARFDPHERLEIIERERVDVLCMAPTEYRVIAKRATLRPLPSLRGAVAAGEALNPEVLHAWQRGDRPVGARRLRADGDGGADRRRGRRDAAARLDGPSAAGRRPAHRRRRAGPARPGDRPDVLRALHRRRPAQPAHGGPATASTPTRTAICTSRAAPTT